MQDMSWDHGLKVTADGNGLVGHAGAVLLRLAADRTGLTGEPRPALARPRKSPQVDRGMALVSMAAAIALGARSMSDIEALSLLEPVFGAPPSDTTIRRTLELAGRRTLARAAKAKARARDRAWAMIEATPGGFPWLEIAGKALPGWLVIDLDATLVTARSDKEGAAPTWKKGYASTRWAHGSPTPGIPWPSCSGRGTPGRTPWPITWKCWATRGCRSRPGSGPG